jgi:hypothetical protein
VIPACIVIPLMFLPALLELKKPRDAGPRIITYNFMQTKLRCLSILTDIEEKIENQLNFKAAIFPSCILNIET